MTGFDKNILVATKVFEVSEKKAMKLFSMDPDFIRDTVTPLI